MRGGSMHGGPNGCLPECRPERSLPVAHHDSMKIFHRMFGRHVPLPGADNWEGGHYVSRCTICRCVITRLPGLPWSRADDQSAWDETPK
jgi:hypothetical protein